MEKRKHITFKALPSDHERWRKALEKAGLTLTDVVTMALNNFTAKVEARKDDKE